MRLSRRPAGRLTVVAVFFSFFLAACSSGDKTAEHDKSGSLEDLATTTLASVPGVVDVQASQIPAAEDASQDPSDPDRWTFHVQITVGEDSTTEQAGEAAELLREFMEDHQRSQRWTAHVAIGEPVAVGEDMAPESPVVVEVWPQVRTTAAGDVADVLAMRAVAGVEHTATASGSFAIRVGPATALPDVMSTLRGSPAWADGGSVHAEAGRVRIMDVPSRVTDAQVQAIIAVAIAHPAADVELTAPAGGEGQPELFLNRLSEAEADAVVAALTDPSLAHVDDDGYRLTFALRSDAGDVTGTVGVVE